MSATDILGQFAATSPVAPPPFVPFPKIYRLRRPVIVTEKIDGTNACVHIDEDGTIRAGSRTRWITPESDNHGFAKWVRDHAEELRGLGIGTHFGEWWGQGIQRGYGLKEKRFSLFNVGRWNEENPPPACCRTVPVLDTQSEMDTVRLKGWIDVLRMSGSAAAPGFAHPEGIVVFHVPSQYLFKWTLEKDDEPKGAG